MSDQEVPRVVTDLVCWGYPGTNKPTSPVVQTAGLGLMAQVQAGNTLVSGTADIYAIIATPAAVPLT